MSGSPGYGANSSPSSGDRERVSAILPHLTSTSTLISEKRYIAIAAASDNQTNSPVGASPFRSRLDT